MKIVSYFHIICDRYIKMCFLKKLHNILNIYFILLSLIIFIIYILNVYSLARYTNIIYLYTQLPALIILIISCINIDLGLYSLLFTFAFSHKLMEFILINILHTTYMDFNYPGINLFCTFIVAYICKQIISPLFKSSINFKILPQRLLLLLLSFHIYICFSSILAIARNLNQTTSTFIFKGLWFNLKHINILDWHSDYHPLKDLYMYSLAISVCYCIYHYLYINKKSIYSLLQPLLKGNFVMLIITLMIHIQTQQYPRIRYFHPFFEDIHSFANFQYFCFISSWIMFFAKSSYSMSKVFYILSSIISLIALILSGSRSTILIGGILLIIWCMWYITQYHKIIFKITFLTISIILISIVSMNFLKTSLLYDFYKFNLKLSYRPEFLISSINMYKEYPIFGIGHGSYFRNSSFIEFSKNNFIAIRRSRGENAHWYPLQLLVELGICGFILCLLLIIVPRNGPLFITTNIILLSILAGNITNHSLLVKEMLCLFFIFIAAHHMQCEQNYMIKRISAAIIKMHTYKYFFIPLMLLIIFIFGILEITHSFKKEPFYYGKKCFKQSKKITHDNWTNSGIWLVPIKQNTKFISLDFHLDTPDLNKYPTKIFYGLIKNPAQLYNTYTTYPYIEINTNSIYRINLDIPKNNKLYFFTYVNRCFIPANYGLSFDSRILGLKIDNFNTK